MTLTEKNLSRVSKGPPLKRGLVTASSGLVNLEPESGFVARSRHSSLTVSYQLDDPTLRQYAPGGSFSSSGRLGARVGGAQISAALPSAEASTRLVTELTRARNWAVVPLFRTA
jgi:hypothetical protein